MTTAAIMSVNRHNVFQKSKYIQNNLKNTCVEVHISAQNYSN